MMVAIRPPSRPHRWEPITRERASATITFLRCKDCGAPYYEGIGECPGEHPLRALFGPTVEVGS